jgi:hypothetical protein
MQMYTDSKERQNHTCNCFIVHHVVVFANDRLSTLTTLGNWIFVAYNRDGLIFPCGRVLILRAGACHCYSKARDYSIFPSLYLIKHTEQRHLHCELMRR